MQEALYSCSYWHQFPLTRARTKPSARVRFMNKSEVSHFKCCPWFPCWQWALKQASMTSNSWKTLMAPNLYPASFQERSDPPQFLSSLHLLGNYCPTFIEIHVWELSHVSAKFAHNTQHKNHHFLPRKQMTANKILLHCAAQVIPRQTIHNSAFV